MQTTGLRSIHGDTGSHASEVSSNLLSEKIPSEFRLRAMNDEASSTDQRSNLQRREPPTVSSCNSGRRSVALGWPSGHAIRGCIAER